MSSANPSSSESSTAPPKIDLAAALNKGGAGATAGLKHVDKKEAAAEKAAKSIPSSGGRPTPKPKMRKLGLLSLTSISATLLEKLTELPFFEHSNSSRKPTAKTLMTL